MTLQGLLQGALIAAFLFVSVGSSPAGEYKLILPPALQEQAANIPADNPLTAEKIALGKQLFFDKRLSADGTIACASCHDPKFGFSDGRPGSLGIKGQRGGRNAPTAINRLFSADQFWDGRAKSLEEQALGPIQNPIEMGNTLEAVVKTLNGMPGYREKFQKVFGTEVTADGIAKAIAAFERTLLSGNSPFDRFQAGDTKALSAAARRGFELFRGEANCVRCHAGFNFTDESYHNIGVGMDRPDPDLGRYNVTNREEHKGGFKTPTLRHIALTAPYMHDGSLRTLEEVIEYYDHGGTRNPNLSKEMRPLNLSARERADLVAFLRSLTGEGPRVTPPALPK